MKFLIALLALTSLNAFAVKTGDMAPDFELNGTKLSDYKGKIVVLEWLNHGCPFVRKHYDSNNMQTLQKEMKEKGIVWLSIISSKPGSQGYVDVPEAIAEKEKYQSEADKILLDPTGKVGKMYEAKTTPHMYVINKDGVLIYQGAIDDKPDTNQESIKGARNYVREAINKTLAKEPIKAGTTKAYGCAVKY